MFNCARFYTPEGIATVKVKTEKEEENVHKMETFSTHQTVPINPFPQ